jgi:hypothetical protein
MANQIASNIPTRTEVAAQVGHHLRQFWTPGMRAALAQIADDTPEQLSPEVHAALEGMA